MYKNIFAEAADYVRIHAPFDADLWIAAVEGSPGVGMEMMALSSYPVLYVTRTGYVPYATKSEIIRRGTSNLILLGGEESISEWVEYVLSTLTKGRVYRCCIPKMSRSYGEDENRHNR